MKKLRSGKKHDSVVAEGSRHCSIAAAVIGGGLLSAGASVYASNQQSGAANNAANNQLQMFNTENSNLAPYRSLGTGSIPALLSAMGYNGTFDGSGNLTGMTTNPNSPLNQTFNFNPSDLQNYPGYQFALQQGELGVNNSAAARGLGTSAADIKNAASYATGLASQTYGQAYNQAQQTFQTNYNAASNNASRVAGLVQSGQNAANMTANAGLTTAMNAGNFQTSAANASAAGTVGAANALTGALGTGLNYGLQSQYLNLANNAVNNGGNLANGWASASNGSSDGGMFYSGG